MSSDPELQKRLMNQLSSVIRGMQTLSDRLSGDQRLQGRLEAKFAGLSRQNNQLRTDVLNVKSELTQFRAEASHQLQSLRIRMGDVEQKVVGSSNLFRDMRVEIRSQYHDILTRVQNGPSIEEWE